MRIELTEPSQPADDWDVVLDELLDPEPAEQFEWRSASDVELPFDLDDRPEWEAALDHEDAEHEPIEAVAEGQSRCDACGLFDTAELGVGWPYCCCRFCGAAPRLPGQWPLCVGCQLEILCEVCGVSPWIARRRCDTCRKYFERHGTERSRELITRSASSRVGLAELDQAMRRYRKANPKPLR